MKLFNLLFIFHFSISFAENNDSLNSESIHELETITVQKRHASHFPVLTATDQFNTSHSKDVGDLFKRFPGFAIAKRGAFAQEPVLRSFRYNQLNILIDGLAKSDNACPNRMDPITVHLSPDDVARIEVIKGPFSVRFGPTFGGIINLLTHSPANLKSKPHRASFSSGYEANGSGKYLRSIVDGRFSAVRWSLSGGFKGFGNYHSGDGTYVPSKFQAFDYAAKIKTRPSPNNLFQLSWRQTFARDVLHAGLPMDLKSDDNSIVTLDHRVDNIMGEGTALTTKLYGAYVDHVMWNKGRKNENSVVTTADVLSREAGTRSELAAFYNNRTAIYTGFNYRYLNKDGMRHRLVKINNCTKMTFDPPKDFHDRIWQDSWNQSAGTYFEAVHMLRKTLSFQAGIRGDFFQSGINQPADSFKSLYQDQDLFSANFDYSFSTLLQWVPFRYFGMQWAFGKGVRHPSLLERYINHFTIGMDAHEYVGNPGLESEKNYQTDFSVSYVRPLLHLRGGVFYSYITDYIGAKVDNALPRKYMPCMNPPSAKRFVNVDAVEQAGYEANAQLKLPFHFTAQSQVSFTYAKNRTWNEPLAEIPPFTNFNSLRYEIPKFTSILEHELTTDQNRVSKSFGESRTNGYQVFHLRFYYRPALFLTLQGGLTNILDEHYTQHLSRAYKNSPDAGLAFYEPGRSFFFAIQVQVK